MRINTPVSLSTTSAGEIRRARLLKVRTGCRTCKRRKIKCDETKPNCNRCSVFGVECGGYNRPPQTCNFGLSKSSRAEITYKDAKTSSKPMAKPYAKPDPKFSMVPTYGSVEEQCALSYYCSSVAVDISKFSSPTFWTVLMPQASWAHPGIKHALVALTSRYASLKAIRHESSMPNTRSIWHYNQSIRFLVINTPTIEVVLLACFLLFTYENLDANFKVSRQHIESGFKIIKEWKSKRRPVLVEDVMSQDIIPRFNEGLAFLQACSTGQLFSPTASTAETALRSAKTIDVDLLVPDPPSTANDNQSGTFSSFQEAIGALANCIRQTSFAYCTRTSTLTPLLLRWRRTLDASRFRKSFDKSLLRMLGVHYYTCRIIGVALHPGEEDPDMAFDLHKDDFVFLMDEMEHLVNNAHIRVSWHFRNKLGLIPPLFLTALKCRDPRTRNRAIELLRSLRIKEGRWNSSCAAKIAEVCRTWEEKERESLSILRAGDTYPGPGSEQRLGTIRVHVSGVEHAETQKAWLTSERLAAPIDVGLTVEEVEAVDWSILDVLDAYGYQDKLSRVRSFGPEDTAEPVVTGDGNDTK